MSDAPFLRSVALFAEFDDAELKSLEDALVASEYGPGETVLEEGSANRALHIVRAGRIRVSRVLDSTEFALCDLVEGQTFGELSILEDGFAAATLRAIPKTTILSLSMNDLAAFLKTSPTAASKFWRALAVDLRRRLLQTNDVVRSYFEINRAIVENPTFREAYALCTR